MCGHSRLWALGMHTNKRVCSEVPPHIVINTAAFIWVCAPMYVWKHSSRHTQQIYFMCNGAIIQINMLDTIIWVSHCMLTTHSTNTKRGGNTKEFTWGEYMWKQCYCRCYKVAEAMAPFLTETQWFLYPVAFFLTMSGISLLDHYIRMTAEFGFR